jgi:predicted enzyme related to lactoylglutathione lyase
VVNYIPIIKGGKMSQHEKIDYIEFPATDLEATKDFFKKAFGWSFNDYGTEYCDFANEGVNGGFYKSEKTATTETGSALIIFYSEDLVTTQKKVEKAGGKVVKSIFEFPGGRRFHFTEPSGNEFAVWSDKAD